MIDRRVMLTFDLLRFRTDCRSGSNILHHCNQTTIGAFPRFGTQTAKRDFEVRHCMRRI